MTELLFTLAIGSFIMAGVLTSYVFCVRGFRGLAHYGEMQQEGRWALEWFARDLRPGLAVSACTSTSLVVLLPATVDAKGNVTVTNRVTHLLSGGEWRRSDALSGRTRCLAENVTQLSFGLFDAAGNSTTQVTMAVSAQVNAVLLKRAGNQTQSSESLSARLRMRNRE